MSLAVDVYWSFRSPYSYLAVPRLRELSEAYEEQGKAELAEKTRSQAAELGGGEDEESAEADE